MHRSRLGLLFCLVGLSGCATAALRGPGPSERAALMGSASDMWAPPDVGVSPDVGMSPDTGVEAAAPELRMRLPISAPSAPFSSSPSTTADLRAACARYDFSAFREFAETEGLDPLGDAFVGNWEDEHLPPYRFMPLTGSLDLDVFWNGSIYGRAWSLDQDLRGIGVGVAWRLREAWQLAAEIGVDPFSTLEEGRFVVLLGVSREF